MFVIPGLNLDSLYICKLDSKVGPTSKVDLSVIVPIFNQENILDRNLSQLATCMSSNWELILIDDSSTDGSLQVGLNWAMEASLHYASLERVRVLQTHNQVFETLCDAIGISESTAPYVLEVQSDMGILESGFDEKLLSAINSSPDLLMISGRGCQTFQEVADSFKAGIKNSRFSPLPILLLKETLGHAAASLKRLFLFQKASLSNNNSLGLPLIRSEVREVLYPSLSSFSVSGRAGRLGQLIEHEYQSDDLNQNLMWVSDTVMRGPLLIHKSRFRDSGGFDTNSFFLGNDDHDLAYRAFVAHGYRTAFVPVGFSSPLSQGSTRKRKSITTLVHFRRSQKRTTKHSPNSGLFRLAKEGVPNPLPVRQIRIFGN